MEENLMKRTVKKKFQTADSVGRFVKEAGVYLGAMFAGVVLKTAMDAPKENADNDENKGYDE